MKTTKKDKISNFDKEPARITAVVKKDWMSPELTDLSVNQTMNGSDPAQTESTVATPGS